MCVRQARDLHVMNTQCACYKRTMWDGPLCKRTIWVISIVGTVDTADIVHTVDTLDIVNSVDSVDNVSSVNSVRLAPQGLQIRVQISDFVRISHAES